MVTPTTPSTVHLRITRTVDHPQEAVFRAWTDPQALIRWFAPNDEMTVEVPTLDLRPGGAYKIEMHAPNNDSYVVGGTYKEITPYSRLVFTWRWAHESEDTLVTVELTPRGKGTEIVLTHERFANAEERDKHHQGWTGCLDRFGRAFTS